jgi:hypothetical protein
MTSAPALRIELRASPSLLLALTLIAALAVLSLLLADIPWPLRGTAIGPIVVLAALAARHLLRPPISSFELGREDARVWRGDQAIPARLRAGRVFGPLLVLRLTWSEGPRPHAATLWLLPDNLDGVQHRRLRMLLSAHAHTR